MIVIKIIVGSVVLWVIGNYIYGMYLGACGTTLEEAREIGKKTGPKSLLMIMAAVTTATILWSLS